MNHTKVCTGCQEKFPATLKYFHSKKSNSDQLNSKCKVCRSNIRKERYRLNPRKELLVNSKWKQKNKKRLNSKERKRRKTDINYKLLKNMRCRLWLLVKQNKSLDTMSLVGCDISILRFHLESQFTDGMNWDNYGDWHIDHIIPCASFDLTNPEQQKKCFHYTNLQPLWAVDNLRKSDKVPDNVQ